MRKDESYVDGLSDDVNVKYTYDTHKWRRQMVFIAEVAIAIMLWYSFSILATIINKRLIAAPGAVNPLTLTFFHVLVSFICDTLRMAWFHRKDLEAYAKCISFKSSFRIFFPLALAMMAAKFLTYTSYGMIPVSLTHTIKALQPFFNVVIVFLWTGEMVDTRTLLTLIPIVFGVIYASVKEVEFVWMGFGCALVSTIVSVWQGVYLKMLMKRGLTKEFIHLCNCTLSCILLLPVIITMELRRESTTYIRWGDMVLSALIQYVSSISSYKAMFLLSSLSYSITSTFKRVAIIVATSLFFGKRLSAGNVLGVGIATIGAILYNIMSKKRGHVQKLPVVESPHKG
ncbi:hypothetical protein WA577_000809, partial [Blastocystis sp. JDR]